MVYAVSPEYVDEMIRAVRVNPTDTSYEEITRNIYAALHDLSRQGVEKIDPEDPLIKQAVALYCRAHYGYDSGSERDRFLEAYRSMSAGIALDYTDYKAGDEE